MWVKTALAAGGMCVWVVCGGPGEDTVVLDDTPGDKVGELAVRGSFKPMSVGVCASAVVPAGLPVAAEFSTASTGSASVAGATLVLVASTIPPLSLVAVRVDVSVLTDWLGVPDTAV